MDRQLVTRIFEDIDSNEKKTESLAEKVEDLSKLVYSHASSLGFVTKIVMIIITFLILTSLTIIVKEISFTPEKVEPAKITLQQLKDDQSK